MYDGLTLCWCSLCAGAVSTELWWVTDYMTCLLVTLVEVYGGLRSLAFCSSISLFWCWKICTQNDSQQFTLFLLLHGFSSSTVWSAFPYSCLLFRMCNAYAESGLFVFMYLVCSRCRIPIHLPVWPKYESLHVLHFNTQMPLEFILFSGILSRSLLYIMLIVRKAIFKLVFFNKLVSLCMSGMWYVKMSHFFVVFVWVWLLFFCVLSIIFFFGLQIICNGNPLLLAALRTVFHSGCFVCSVIGSVIILFM